jgi:hypothetical protein
VPVPPSFAPNTLLDVPGDYGEQEDVQWMLATTLPEALRLVRAREQHELAYRVHRQLSRHSNSIADLAAALGMRRENLWSKLRGYRPAQEEDLILWSWVTGQNRRSYPLSLVLDAPEAVALPRFTVPRGRTGERS